LIQICFAGYSGSPPPDVVANAVKVLEELKRLCKRFAVIVGGYWGLMRIVADKAIELGLPLTIFVPIEAEDTAFPEEAIIIRTSASFRIRSVVMVRSCNAVVVLGGESGTIQEAVTAYTESKPVYLLLSGMPSDRLSLLAPHLDTRRLAEIKVFSNPEKLAEELAKDICIHR
jgi:hypothetical protein